MAYDILIQGGEVLDGESKGSRTTDIGIKGEKIAGMGTFSVTDAKTIIKAEGHYVTPGFIDISNHSDTHLTMFQYPRLESMAMQGVTTIIGGNCGASLAPLASPEAIHAIDKWADPSRINVNWNTMGEYLGEMEKLKLGVNYGTFVGYGTLRRSVIGNEIRLLTTEEREKVKFLLRESMTEGAYGISFGLTYGHERISSSEEIIDVVRAIRGTRALVKIHLRSEGAELLGALNEAIHIGRESEVSIQISHLKAIGKKTWPLFAKGLEMISRACASGVDIHFDVSPFNATGSLLYLLIPAWARHGGFIELFKKIDDAVFYAKIIAELDRFTLHYDRILITSAHTKTAVGKTIQEIADEMGLPPAEALVRLVRVNEGRVSIVGRTLSRQNMERGILHDASYVASDGEGYDQIEFESGNLAHPRAFGAFPHFWHLFVSDFSKMAPHEAIVKITSGPAQALGLAERGVLKVGNVADIAVFNKRLFKDRATYRNPYRYPAGIASVIINGSLVVHEGTHTGMRAGSVLRKI